METLREKKEIERTEKYIERIRAVVRRESVINDMFTELSDALYEMDSVSGPRLHIVIKDILRGCRFEDPPSMNECLIYLKKEVI